MRPQPHPRPDAILAPMTAPTLDAEPACPGPCRGYPYRPTDPRPPCTPSGEPSIRSLARPGSPRLPEPLVHALLGLGFPPRLVDAYSDNAHDETLVACRNDGTDGDPVAIVPLMHRHEVEPLMSRRGPRCATPMAPV